MIEIKLDEEYIEQEFKKRLEKRLDELQAMEVWWDMNDLQEKTRMSVNTIKTHFFYDERFPKSLIGGKWYFPAEETREFLLVWIKEQS